MLNSINFISLCAGIILGTIYGLFFLFSGRRVLLSSNKVFWFTIFRLLLLIVGWLIILRVLRLLLLPSLLGFLITFWIVIMKSLYADQKN